MRHTSRSRALCNLDLQTPPGSEESNGSRIPDVPQNTPGPDHFRKQFIKSIGFLNNTLGSPTLQSAETYFPF